MRISDWSSDVCSSDLRSRRTDLQFLLRPVRRLCISIDTRGRHGRRKRSPARRTAPLSGNSERSWPLIHIVGTQRSEEHTSELQSLMRISYAVFCLNKKTSRRQNTLHTKQKPTIHKPSTP